VYRNGVLLGSADYTASNGLSVVLVNGCTVGDLVEVISFQVSSVLNAIPATAGSVGSSNIANGVTINFADGSASTPSITNDGDNNTGIFFPAADTIAFAEGGAESMRLDSSGNLGIGTTSPTNKLEVNGIVKLTPITYSSTPSSSYGGFLQGVNDGAFRVDSYNPTGNSYLAFGTNASSAAIAERMRITSGGDLYVGTTTGTIGTSNKGFSINGGDGEVRFSRLVGSSSPVMNAYGSQGEARIMGDGDLENTNNRYTGISDIKFKQNIVDANSQWADIKAIQVRNYELVEYPDRKQIGVVAQEIEQVCPKLVIEREDANGETYKSVAYSVLYMKAVKALQEAMERIETLEARLTALENK
jgi:hypothetical protein